MTTFLSDCIKRFEYYKSLGEKTFDQLSDEQLFWQYNAESNSVATLVKHLWGNMLSRWTDFLTTDGEKEGRERDAEFENDIKSREEMMTKWNEGWNCLFATLKGLSNDDLVKTVYIRQEPHTVIDAILRQLAHYPYHIGQIVYVAKMMIDENWKTLSIARNKSKEYNDAMMNRK